MHYLQGKFPEQAEHIAVDDLNPAALVIPQELVPSLHETLAQDPELSFDYFEFSTCTDRPPDYLDFVSSVYSTSHKHRLGLKVRLPRDNPSISTVSHIWANADWNEREVFDLFGVHFHGHPDLRRLMMPEDWEGHPLRKDYMHPNVVKRPD